jgi:hypothetical protein
VEPRNEGRERWDTRRERENGKTWNRVREREREKEGRGGRSKSGWLDIQVGKLPKREWKKALSSACSFSHFPVSFVLFLNNILRKNQKDYFHLKEIWTTLF